MGSRFLKLIWIFVISLLLAIAFMWLRGGYVTILGLTGFPLAMLVYMIVYFVATVLLLKRNSDKLPSWSILVAILLGASILEIYARFIREGGFERSLISLPDVVIRIVAPLLGYLYYRTSRKLLRILLVVATLLFTLWASYFGFELWAHKRTFGTVNGRQTVTLTQPLDFYQSHSSVVRLPEQGEKYILLDFWSSGCGACL